MPRVAATARHELGRPVSLIVTAVAGSEVPVHGTLTLSVVVLIVLSPVLLPNAMTESVGRWVLAGVAACFVSGLAIATVGGADVSNSVKVGTAYFCAVLNALSIVYAMLWSSRKYSLRLSLAAFAVGSVIASPINYGAWFENPWKFQFGFPAALLLLIALWGRIQAQLVGLVGLAAVSLFFDSRSFAALCLISAAVVGLGRRRSGRSVRWGVMIPLTAAATACTYFAAVRLAASGVFGAAVASRTILQESSAAGLLLGGRPEWIATSALIRNWPWGFGLGAVPGPDQFAVGSSALYKYGIDTSKATYFQNYTFYREFRMHSILADFWVSFGWIGFGAMCACVFLAAWTTVTGARFADVAVPAAFVSLVSVWYIGFGPSYSNLPNVALMLAVGATVAWRRRHESVCD